MQRLIQDIILYKIVIYSEMMLSVLLILIHHYFQLKHKLIEQTHKRHIEKTLG
tara:strand:+ start:2116 stop:2274 length:159 start_codon:yes stop_codon:yes gene_type:complete